MFFCSFLFQVVSFVAFPESNDAILSTTSRDLISIETSGSIGIFYDGKCHKTTGNETIESNEYFDWCSNIALDKEDPSQNPFIQYSIKGKQMKIRKFSVRYGCCRHVCCTEDGKYTSDVCCCLLYSYSLHGSNDNKTWKVIHKVVKDKSVGICGTKTIEFNSLTEPYTYLRLVQDEEWPNCIKCLQINQIEFYGETVNAIVSGEESDDDESISIIGRVKERE